MKNNTKHKFKTLSKIGLLAIALVFISNSYSQLLPSPIPISKSLDGMDVSIGYGAEYIVHQPSESDLIKINESDMLYAWGCQYLYYRQANPSSNSEPDHSESILTGKIGKNALNGNPTLTHSFRLFDWMPWEKGCPFEKYGSMCYYRPYFGGQQLIFIDETGFNYSVFTDNGSYSWTQSYNINSMGGGGCPYRTSGGNGAGIGPCMYYRPLNGGTQLIFFDKAGLNYTVYSEYTGITPQWTPSFSISQFGGGTLPSGLSGGVGACTFYRDLSGGKQYILFNRLGDKYWVYTEYTTAAPTWQGGSAGFSVATSLGSSVSGKKCPFPQIGAAFHYANNDLVFYDKEKEAYIKFNASTSLWEDFDGKIDMAPNFIRNENNTLGVYFLKKTNTFLGNQLHVLTDIYYRESNNNGYTFGPEKNITNHIWPSNLNTPTYFVFENCRIIKLNNGDKLLPIQVLVQYDVNGNLLASNNYLEASLVYRLPNGIGNFNSFGNSNWTINTNNYVKYQDITQAQEPGCVQYDTQVLMFNRPLFTDDKILLTRSTNNGLTWGTYANGNQWKTTMDCGNTSQPWTAPNNMKTYKNPNFNNRTDIFNFWCNDGTGNRNNFSVSVSTDGGLTWTTGTQIKEIDPFPTMEFGYPAAVIYSNDTYLLYGRKTQKGAGYASTLNYGKLNNASFY